MSKGLFKEVVDNIDLPKSYAEERLAKILTESNANPDTVSLEELRKIAADLVRDVLTSLKEETEKN